MFNVNRSKVMNLKTCPLSYRIYLWHVLFAHDAKLCNQYYERSTILEAEKAQYSIVLGMRIIIICHKELCKTYKASCGNSCFPQSISHTLIILMFQPRIVGIRHLTKHGNLLRAYSRKFFHSKLWKTEKYNQKKRGR